jgi:hypothetical protein
MPANRQSRRKFVPEKKKKRWSSLLQKHEENGDRVEWIVLNDFGHSGLNAFPLFVVPAKAGTQIRENPVDCAFPLDFPPFCSFTRLWISVILT